MSGALKRKLKNKKAPEGWDMIEEVVEDFEQQMKDAVNDEHDGKRKCEASWKIHRIHWEKNRFIYDLMYVRKVMSKELVSGDGMEKNILKLQSTACYSMQLQYLTARSTWLQPGAATPSSRNRACMMLTWAYERSSCSAMQCA